MNIPGGRRRSQREGQAGFSLIEAMVAIAIFVIGVLGAYKMQLYATQGNALANRVSTATNWAAYAVEELLANEFESDVLEDKPGTIGWNYMDEMSEANSDGVLFIRPDGSTQTTSPGDELYSIYWNIVDGNPDPTQDESIVLNDVKLIRVHVVREGGIGKGNLYSHTYYKAKWPEAE